MNLDNVLSSTRVYRKGEVVNEHDIADGAVKVVEIMGYPHEDEARTHEELIDMHFITVGVTRPEAPEEMLREEFQRTIDTYPNPDRLAGGPSYIEVGAEFGSQEIALRWMALGKALGFWDVIIPATLGFKGEEADQLAGSGFVMISPKLTSQTIDTNQVDTGRWNMAPSKENQSD